MGWYAFYVGRNIIVQEDGNEFFHYIGDVGVGKCSLSPGIIDNINGSIYVVSDKYMKHYYETRILKKRKSIVKAEDIQKAIELFYKPGI